MPSTVSNEEAGTAVGRVSSSFPDLRFPREELVPPFCYYYLEIRTFVRLLRRDSHSLAAPFQLKVFNSNVIYISQEQRKVNSFNLYQE